MSVRLMSQVWECKLTHAQQSVLLVMADYADDNGENCFPSIARIAHKTDISERHVRRVVRQLERMGIVLEVEPGGGRLEGTEYRTTIYRIDLTKADMKSAFIPKRRRAQKVANPDKIDGNPDKINGNPDTRCPPIHQNHQIHQEPSVEQLRGSTVRDGSIALRELNRRGRQRSIRQTPPSTSGMVCAKCGGEFRARVADVPLCLRCYDKEIAARISGRKYGTGAL